MRKYCQILVARFIAWGCFVLPLTPTSALAAATPSVKAACRIEIDNPHLSTSQYEKNLTNYVKVNARSICNTYQSSVSLTVQIYKIGFLQNHLVAQSTTKPNNWNLNSYKVENKDTLQKCTSGKRTTYFGIAFSKAMIGGKWQYAGRTRSRNSIPLKCGT